MTTKQEYGLLAPHLPSQHPQNVIARKDAEIAALRSQLAEVDGSNHLPDLARLSMVELNATAMRKSLNQDNDLMAAYIHRIVELEQRAEHAEAEIAALRAQVDDLRAGQANDDRDHRALTERAERAEAERDALKQDAERLDWLERVGFSTKNEARCDQPMNVHCWGEGQNRRWTAHWIGSEYLTARDAIDAARTKENQRGEE